MTKGKTLYSTKETRKRLGGIGHTKLYELFGAGKLTALKLAGRTMVAEDEIDRLIESLPSAIEARAIRSTSRRLPREL